MAVTHFRITKLPDAAFIFSKKGADAIALNTDYPIADQQTLNFKRIAALNGHYHKDFCLFKTYDEVLNKYSNEAKGNIEFKDNSGTDPAGDNDEYLFVNNQSDNILSLININAATEFIEIISLSGVNKLVFDSRTVLVGDRFAPFELHQLIYTVLSEGGGAPYFEMTYRVGKGTTLFPTEYTLTLNVESLASINKTSQTSITTSENFDDGSGGTIQYDVIRETVEIEVTGGYQNGTAELSFVINSPFLTASSIELQSEVAININNQETVYISNQTVNLVAELDEKGYAKISIENRIVKDDASETGQIDITLSSVNQDPALVSATNTAQAITNFS